MRQENSNGWESYWQWPGALAERIQQIGHDLVSFVLRRSICGESTRNYGRWFVEAIATIKEDPRKDLRNYWVRRGWPDDASFVSRMREFPIYRRESKKCRMVLMALEKVVFAKL